MRKSNHAAIRKSCAYMFFPLSDQVVKIGKVFASDSSYATFYDFLSAGFFIGLLQQHSNLQPLSS